MEKTANYQLPQWEANDEIKREDFNAAMEGIDGAIQSASYVVGSYTGDGAELTDGGQRIELGFHPRFLIICKGLTNYGSLAPSTMIVTDHPEEKTTQFITLDDTGFTVGLCSTLPATIYPLKINVAGTVYPYIAFR